MDGRKYVKLLGKIEVLQHIGDGGNTKGVFKALIPVKRKDGQGEDRMPVVLKQFYLKDLQKADVKTRYDREKEIGMKIRHENLIRTIGEVKTDTSIYLMMEYANGGSLKDFLNYFSGPVNEQYIRIFLPQLLQGLFHLHNLNLMNRDIKLENFLLHFDPKPIYDCDHYKNVSIPYEKQDYSRCYIKMCDFGFIKEINQDAIRKRIAQTVVYTEGYKSKEVESGLYDENVDYWSLGMLIRNLLIGREEREPEEDMDFFLDPENSYSIEILEILDCLLKDDPSTRAAAKTILPSHDYLNPKHILTYIDRNRVLDQDKLETKLLKIDRKNYTNYKKIYADLLNNK